jgi:hypothetical protein
MTLAMAALAYLAVLCRHEKDASSAKNRKRLSKHAWKQRQR